jgi:hypothetical protein
VEELMLIPTTTVTVITLDTSGPVDPYEDTGVEETHTVMPAHISAPGGVDAPVGGDKEVVTAVAFLPGHAVVTTTDRVSDNLTGDTYAVVWTRRRRGLGLDHVEAGLRSVKGGASV